MKLRTIYLPLLALVACAFPPLPASADQPASITTYFNACPPYGGVRICSGEVPSYDETHSPLDVDLSLPADGRTGRHPLIIMLHGFGNNKHEWESVNDEADGADKWHWNSHWFATHGYYVLAYTARGFDDTGPDHPAWQPATPCDPNPTGCPGSGSFSVETGGDIRLKTRDETHDTHSEIKDTQYLAQLVAAAFPDLDPNAVAVTGGSYGGGESWMQASYATWSVDSSLPTLQLQVAVPKYPWTDLAYSLAPNGHPGPLDGSIYSSSQDSPTSPVVVQEDANPFGQVKASWVHAFFADGNAHGSFETAPDDLPTWYARANAGDPYDLGGPGTDLDVMANIRKGLTEWRSSFYHDEGWAAERNNREVAIFSISGWSDDLFPPVESFRQFKYLKSKDPLWPVAIGLGDVGHSRANNPPYEWRHLNDQAWQFLQSNINGSHRQQTTVFSMPSACVPTGQSDEAQPIVQLTGSTPEDLSRGTLSIQYTQGDTLTNYKPPTLDPDNEATDPVTGFLSVSGCRHSAAPTFDPTLRYTARSEPLTQPVTYVGLGFVRVTYTLAPSAGLTTAELNARIWDQSPDGMETLMTRGTYRIDGPGYDTVPSGTIDLPLFGNQWPLQPGHKVRLDLTQVDFPTFLYSNQVTSVSFAPPLLVLPSREASNRVISGS